MRVKKAFLDTPVSVIMLNALLQCSYFFPQTIETFLSKDLNYVISSSAPSRSSSQPKVADGGPESPSFANTPSPYSSTPSPTCVAGKILPVCH